MGLDSWYAVSIVWIIHFDPFVLQSDITVLHSDNFYQELSADILLIYLVSFQVCKSFFRFQK